MPVTLNATSLFTNNFTQCTYTGYLYNYTLVKNNDSYENALALTDAPKANFQVSGETITIKRDVPGVMDMHVMVSDLGRFAFKHISFHICGYENLTAISNDSIELFIDNIYPTPISLNISNYFRTTIANCTYTPWKYNYTLVKSNNSYENAQPLTDGPLANFNLTGDTLTIHKNSPGVMDAFIMISASPTRYAFKHIKIEVCGYEQITLKNSSSLEYLIDNIYPTLISFNVSDLFTSNYTRCTFTPWLYNYTLVKANNSYENAQALTDGPLANFNLTGDTLTIHKNSAGLMDAFIMISASPTRYAFKHIKIDVCGYENLTAKI